MSPENFSGDVSVPVFFSFTFNLLATTLSLSSVW